MPKDKFYGLLKKLFATLEEENVLPGFKKCGIVLLSRQKVLDKLPSPNESTGDSCRNESQTGEQAPTSVNLEAIDDTFKDLLKSL